MKLESHESELIGSWTSQSGNVVADATCLRIDQLIANVLTKLSRDASGWNVLYRDPSDGRLWELTYPQGHMHGGGPPSLKYLTLEQATNKYGIPPK